MVGGSQARGGLGALAQTDLQVVLFISFHSGAVIETSSTGPPGLHLASLKTRQRAPIHTIAVTNVTRQSEPAASKYSACARRGLSSGRSLSSSIRCRSERLELDGVPCSTRPASRNPASEALRFCFEVLARDTELDGLQLEIELCPRRHHCGDCNATFIVRDHDCRCPTCRQIAAECISGDELELAYVEVEEDEPSAIGAESSQ
jgi:hypothetical protein